MPAVTVVSSSCSGADNQLLSIMYALDDCILECSDNPLLLRKRTVFFPPRKVAAGPHRFRFVIKVHGADGTKVLRTGNGIPVDVLPGGTSTITLRLFENERAPASDRIQFIVQTTRSKNPPAEP